MHLSKELLFNPFRRIAGAEALSIGAGFMLLTACIAWPASTHFDGVLDAHAGSPMPAYVYFIEPLVAWTCAFLTFFCIAQFGGGRFRAIDLAGTLALSRAPMLFAAPVGLALTGPADPLHPGAAVLLAALPLLIAGIWMIALMYNAFRVSVNPRPSRAVPLFILALVLAETLSKVAFHYFYNNLPL